MTLLIIVVLLVGAVALLWVIGIYNRLIKLRVSSENAWADIDVQLKRRYDLIPNLIETVKGYVSHERDTFEAVVVARNQAMSAQGPGEKSAAEGALGQALKSLFALAEAYPQLRAVETFNELQDALRKIEDAIQSARRYYNAVVRDFNTLQEQFPSNIIASTFGFTPKEFFEAGADERATPKVDFSSSE